MRGWPRLVVVAAFSVAGLLAPARARADATPDAQAEARKEMRQGIEALEAGRPESALAGFRRASALVPEANLPHRYAARALEALGRLDEAVEEYEEYLRIKADVSDAASVRATVEALRARTALGTVALLCDPEEVAVTVDGRDVARGPGGALLLSAGAHRLRLRAPARLDRDLEVDVVAGTTVSPACVLERELPPAPASGGASLLRPGGGLAPEPPHPSRPVYARWWFWTGASAVVAGAVISILVLSRTTSGPPSTEGGNHPFP